MRTLVFDQALSRQGRVDRRAGAEVPDHDLTHLHDAQPVRRRGRHQHLGPAEGRVVDDGGDRERVGAPDDAISVIVSPACGAAEIGGQLAHDHRVRR